MHTVRTTPAVLTLAALALIALLVLTGCSSSQSGTGDGLHAVVPSVTGMSVSNATEKIHDAGYEVGSVAPKGAEGSDVVQVQDPAAGTALPRGGEVSLQCAP